MPEQAPAVDSPAVGRLIRFLVCGLPLGLFIMGALSFVIYFQKRNAAKELPTKPSQLSAMMRRDINAEDLARYRRIFTQDIGPRTPEQFENIEIAASFITSTMGFDNMGYQVTRFPYDGGGRTLVDLSVELVGTRLTESVTVGASYVGDKEDTAASISALMVLAHHFTGTRHARSLRFVARAQVLHPPGKNSALIRLADASGRSQKETSFILNNGVPIGEKMLETSPALNNNEFNTKWWNIDAAAPATEVEAELKKLAGEITKALDEP